LILTHIFGWTRGVTVGMRAPTGRETKAQAIGP